MARVIERCPRGEYPYEVFVTMAPVGEEQARTIVAEFDYYNERAGVEWVVVPDGYRLQKLFSET